MLFVRRSSILKCTIQSDGCGDVVAGVMVNVRRYFVENILLNFFFHSTSYLVYVHEHKMQKKNLTIRKVLFLEGNCAINCACSLAKVLILLEA